MVLHTSWFKNANVCQNNFSVVWMKDSAVGTWYYRESIGDWKWCSEIYLVVLLLFFLISVQDRITRHSLITATKNNVYEQVLFFGLLTDQKLVPSHRKLYTMKQFIQSKEMCHEIYKTSIKQRELPTNWVKRKTNLQNVKRKYKSPSKYRRRCGWANMKKIETDCNCGFWKLVSLTC